MRWSCHSGLATLCKFCRPFPPPVMGTRLPFLSKPAMRTRWMAGNAPHKSGDVKTNPGPTTTRRQVWIYHICHRQIQVRNQISIRCTRIEHWMRRYPPITIYRFWTCHQHRQSRLTTHTYITPPSLAQAAYPLPQHHPHHRNQNTDTYPTFPMFLQNW